MPNPHEVLGVERSASQQKVKAAYLKLAKELHPDQYANKNDDVDHRRTQMQTEPDKEYGGAKDKGALISGLSLRLLE
jgi:curved DNA-binding protein CbpA